MPGVLQDFTARLKLVVGDLSSLFPPFPRFLKTLTKASPLHNPHNYYCPQNIQGPQILFTYVYMPGVITTPLTTSNGILIIISYARWVIQL